MGKREAEPETVPAAGASASALEWPSYMTKDERLAYPIISGLLCLGTGILYLSHPWRMAWGLDGGWRLALALACWLVLSLTSLWTKPRAEFAIVTAQFLLSFVAVPLHGVSLPTGLLLVILLIYRVFVRLTLGRGSAILFVTILTYLGFILTAPDIAEARGPEESIALFAGLAFGIWLSLICRRHLEDRAGTAEALCRIQAVTSELFDANVHLQDRVDQATAEAAHRERLSLARELHDTVAYTFTTIAAAIETGAELIRADPEAAVRELNYARSLTSEGLREVRGVVRQLRDKAERGFRGPERWAALAEVFHEATGVIVTMDLPEPCPQIASELDVMIYRLIQEGMINAFRHGRATVIWVRVWLERGHLCVLISDNGCGAKEIGKGFGLVGMQERVHALGGRLSWRTSPGAGFDLAVEIPFEERSVCDLNRI